MKSASAAPPRGIGRVGFFTIAAELTGEPAVRCSMLTTSVSGGMAVSDHRLPGITRQASAAIVSRTLSLGRNTLRALATTRRVKSVPVTPTR